MKTLIKSQYWNILNVFYNNKNKPVHLRELSRLIGLKEGPLSRHLANISFLKVEKEANLKKFNVKNTELFSVLDIERFNNLNYIRKNAINFYVSHLKEKPVFIILFGSTAKKTEKKDSDIDILIITNKKVNNETAIKYAESQTGIKISEFQLTFNEFKKELKLKEDPVIQSALETGFPIYNHQYYYHERENT